VTRAEWARLRDGIAALGADARDAALARLRALPRDTRVACPLLDTARGECTVYAHRPAACRAYGFYAARDGGRHCADVGAVAGDDVVWGNHEALDRALVALSGEPRSVIDWAADEPDAPAR
jgi:Fe-S-cluster containining protein